MTDDDWKKGAAKRRDARATKSEETSPGKGKTKSTKRWCKGKAGTEHKLVCHVYSDVKHSGYSFFESWRLLMCSVCGKEIDTWSPPWMGLGRAKPDWVDK